MMPEYYFIGFVLGFAIGALTTIFMVYKGGDDDRR